MLKILIVYGTKEGQTAKIAKTISQQLQDLGHEARLINSRQIPSDLTIENYDGFICGAPIHASKYPLSFRRWVKTNSRSLDRLPNAFFSVCLGVLETKNPKTQETVRSIAMNFFKSCSWDPMMWTTFAGALTYTKYGWFVRWMMRRISEKAGGDTNTSRDYEYTNWDEVRAFAKDFVKLVYQVREGVKPQLETWSEHNFIKT